MTVKFPHQPVEIVHIADPQVSVFVSAEAQGSSIYWEDAALGVERLLMPCHSERSRGISYFLTANYADFRDFRLEILRDGLAELLAFKRGGQFRLQNKKPPCGEA
jgi:hypothetical protein